MSHTPVLVVHGGAGSHALIALDGYTISQVEEGVITAARAGYKVLTSGGTAVDAVEAAVVAMEDIPIFNCGRGSCLTMAGTVEMDASIMNGTNLKTGGVACIEGVANPIKVSRIVMEQTPHVLLAGEGARQFAEQSGAKMVTKEALITEKAMNRLKKNSKFGSEAVAEITDKMKLCSEAKSRDDPKDPREHDTVGAVAMDTEGHVAYATSTGGRTAKMPGRVGDTPLVGAGGYADDRSGTVCTTGDGEAFIKVTLARHTTNLMEQGFCAQEAVEKALDYCLDRVGGRGGCVAVDLQGGIGIHWNTLSMAWASAKDGSISYGVHRNQLHTQSI